MFGVANMQMWNQKWDLKRAFRRWRASRVELLADVSRLRKEGEQMQRRLAALQQAKDQAVKHAEDRRREKETLRLKLRGQKHELEARDLQIEQLGVKITELRDEIEKIRREGKP